LLRADAIYLVCVEPESLKKDLCNVDQFDANGLDQQLIKRQFELASPPLLFRIGVALNAVDANLPK